jgi:hypothetical protein
MATAQSFVLSSDCLANHDIIGPFACDLDAYVWIETEGSAHSNFLNCTFTVVRAWEPARALSPAWTDALQH